MKLGKTGFVGRRRAMASVRLLAVSAERYHMPRASSPISTAWTHIESGDQPDRKLVANGGNRVSRVVLCAQDFPAQCNRRELQVSGVLRSFFGR
jgi:hypothetical protein